MAFMIPVAEHFAAYHVETNAGEEIIPVDVAGEIDLASEPMKDEWEKLITYCEGSRIEGVERKEGWYSRLSAPGHLDCTSWGGPFDTAEEAFNAVKEAFEVDDDGNELEECEP